MHPGMPDLPMASLNWYLTKKMHWAPIENYQLFHSDSIEEYSASWEKFLSATPLCNRLFNYILTTQSRYPLLTSKLDTRQYLWNSFDLGWNKFIVDIFKDFSARDGKQFESYSYPSLQSMAALKKIFYWQTNTPDYYLLGINNCHTLQMGNKAMVCVHAGHVIPFF